jgi:hypothetical protein
MLALELTLRSHISDLWATRNAAITSQHSDIPGRRCSCQVTWLNGMR